MTKTAVPPLLRLAVNVVLFQSAWFAAILGGAQGLIWAGPLAAAVAVSVHLVIFRDSAVCEAFIIGGVTLLGIVVETLFMLAGALTYAGTNAGQALPPVWIVALWAAFGTLPSASFAWLKERWVMQAVLGAVVGPLTYYAGVRMGAASLGTPLPLALAILAGGWALAMPACFVVAHAARRFKRAV